MQRNSLRFQRPLAPTLAETIQDTIGSMGAAKILLTAEEFDNYPFEEDKRYELDEGELIEMTRPAYKHNRVLANLHVRLRPTSEKIASEDADLREPVCAISTRRSPDVAIILGDHKAELEKGEGNPYHPRNCRRGAVTQRNARRIHRKMNQYFKAGVKKYGGRA